MVAILVSGVVGATTLVLPNLEAIASGAESSPTFASSPGHGLTGTAIRASGAGCLLPGTDTPGEGVVLDLHPPAKPVVASTTVIVGRDGAWSGTLVVPADTPAARYRLTARCTYPGFDEAEGNTDPVTYTDRHFRVTGEGSNAPVAGFTEAGAPVTTTSTTEAGAIEPLPSYDGQSTCSPTAKPGMSAFKDMVMGAFGGRDFGIVRACNIGGTSEHKEGRAWDWGMNANSSTDRAKVQRLMTWLFATDGAGNNYAMARRLGIMYIIWNRQMFRLYRPEAGWQPYSGPVPHTDHVHFSLTRAGGAKTTSFWTGHYPGPDSSNPPPTQPPPTQPPSTPPGKNPAMAMQSLKVAVGGTYDDAISGDFNGDHKGDLLWYGAGEQPDYLWFGKRDGTFRALPVTVRGVYRPLVGDFNGDGRDDILWYGPGADDDYLWRGSANDSFVGQDVSVGREYDHPMVGDFNGDHYDDVMWYQSGAGFDFLWQGTAYGFAGRGVRANGTYRSFTGDFDGDGRTDIFWYGPGDALDYLWFGDADGGFTGQGINETGDTEPVIGDYNDNGSDDIVWYGAGSRPDGAWFGQRNRTFRATAITVAGTYDEPLVGDYDGNGHSDILWYGAGDRPDYLWRY